MPFLLLVDSKSVSMPFLLLVDSKKFIRVCSFRLEDRPIPWAASWAGVLAWISVDQ